MFKTTIQNQFYLKIQQLLEQTQPTPFQPVRQHPISLTPYLESFSRVRWAHAHLKICHKIGRLKALGVPAP